MHGGRWSERFAETVLRATKEGRGIFESTCRESWCRVHSPLAGATARRANPARSDYDVSTD
jgi:hypothetical protein